MLSLLGGVFLGWSLGANDAGNVFGSAVASKMIRFSTAAILASVFVLVGALVDGRAGIETLAGLTDLNLAEAVVSSVAAALTVTLMTFLGLPVSTSQAVVGAIIGIGLMGDVVNFSGLIKVVICWLGAPLGGMLAAVLLYKVLARVFNQLNLSLFQSDRIYRIGLILVGSYGAYALGANNVANVTAVYVGAGLLDVPAAALIGGLSIVFGIATFSRRVMETVGRNLVRLDPFSALVVVSAQAVTVHLFSFIGVPVSTSHAVVGAVLGVGLLRGVNIVRAKTLRGIVTGWTLTPALALGLAMLIDFVRHLEYVH